MSEDDAERAARRRDTPRRQRVRKNWKPLGPQIPLRPFIDYAWDHYDPRAVASYLLDISPSFYRHTSILHEGFCAWVVCPGRRKVYRDGMVYRIAKAVEDAETPWREGANAFNHSVGETVGRVLRADRRFFEEVYYPTGGTMRILRALSRPAFKRALAKRATPMLEAVHLMAVFHCHVSHLSTAGYRLNPSRETAGAVVRTAFGSGVSRRFVEGIEVWKKKEPAQDKSKIKEEKCGRVKIDMEYKLRSANNIVASWNASRASVAYAYAAASIATDDGRTLLHDLIAGRSTLKRHRDLMPLWCGRARYAVESIIGRCYPERRVDPFDFGARLPPIEPIAFEMPSLFQLTPQTLLQKYKDQKRPSAGQ